MKGNYRLYRAFLAIVGFGCVSFLLTFWSLHISPMDQKSNAMLNHDPSLVANNGTAPIVHIVYTRFMQHQPNLTHLGLARLELLSEFFLQSLQVQTTRNFVVVVRTDPDLSPSLREPLFKVLNSQQAVDYLLIGTNENKPDSHQYQDVVERLQNPSEGGIWNGAIDKIREYLLSPNALIIETRLDSDDGLHREYLETLQDQARTYVKKANSYRIWCAGRYLEWQFMAPWELSSSNHRRLEEAESITAGDEDAETDDAGSPDAVDERNDSPSDDDSALQGLGCLVSLQMSGCLTAGLSVAYYPPDDNIPSIQKHHTLTSGMPRCNTGKKGHKLKTNCLNFMKLNPSVIRARTPTSAGMMNVIWDWDSTSENSGGKFQKNPLYKKYEMGANQQKRYQKDLWQFAPHIFGISTSRVRKMKEVIKENLVLIANENLDGQCSVGHSCKNSSQIMLRGIAKAAKEK